MPKKAVILLSGGLDSATCLAIVKSIGYECYALTIDYGQRHHFEISASRRVADYFKVNQHVIFNLPINQFGHSALTDYSIDVPEFAGSAAIPVTYVPARNTIFLSIALAWAETLSAFNIFYGANAIDYSNYPDCRPEYINAFEQVANLATKLGSEGNKFNIQAPLVNLTKAEVIKRGVALGVDYGITVSCYRATEDGLACGSCDACTFRRQGFAEAGVADPTRYNHTAASLQCANRQSQQITSKARLHDSTASIENETHL